MSTTVRRVERTSGIPTIVPDRATQFIGSRIGNIYDPVDRIAAGQRFLAAMAADIRSRQPWKILIAEDMQGDPAITRPSDQDG